MRTSCIRSPNWFVIQHYQNRTDLDFHQAPHPHNFLRFIRIQINPIKFLIIKSILEKHQQAKNPSFPSSNPHPMKHEWHVFKHIYHRWTEVQHAWRLWGEKRGKTWNTSSITKLKAAKLDIGPRKHESWFKEVDLSRGGSGVVEGGCRRLGLEVLGWKGRTALLIFFSFFYRWQAAWH